jgi:hypothetical protein
MMVQQQVKENHFFYDFWYLSSSNSIGGKVTDQQVSEPRENLAKVLE